MPRFRPFPNRPASVRYFSVPADVRESPRDLVRWARRAIESAARASSEDAVVRKRKSRSSLHRG
jgi:TfoX/Sxy family transcriptional regulator of competence genes